MNKKDVMNIEGLFILSAIARNSGKRQASKEYNTSVDTINKYIDNLENELGFKVLASNGRGSVLTPRAEGLVKKVDQISEILKSIYASSVDRNDVAGEVRVGTSFMISSNLSLRNISDFADKYPNIVLSFITSGPGESNESIISNFDIALTAIEPTNSELVIIDSKKINCGFFASRDYLSHYGYPVDLEDMLQNYRILHKEGLEKHISVWADVIKRAKKVCYTSNSPFLLIDALRQGLGISVLPLRLKEEGLVCLDNIRCESCVTVYLVAHKNTKDMPRIRAVLNYYKDLLAEM